MKKELLKKEKNILKALHVLYDFDFQQEFEIVKFTGNFTHNRIKKELNKDELQNHNIAVVITNVKYRESQIFVTKVTDTSFSLSFPKNIYYMCKINDFYTKSYFEDIRKEKDLVCYIVSQKNEHKKPASPKKIDYTQRFKYVRHIGLSDGRGRNGVSQVYLICKNGTGKEFTYRTQDGFYSTNINDFVDKSGYLLEEHRGDLLRKAKALKAKKEKNKVDSMDFSSDLEKAGANMDEIKKAISKAFIDNFNYETICKIDLIITRLRWALNDFEIITEKNKKKKFSSLESALYVLNRLNEKISEIGAMIQELFAEV